MRPSPASQRLTLVPLGEVPRLILAEVGSALHDVYGATVAVREAQPRPAYAFNKDRNQYHSTAIVRRLAQSRHEGELVLGLTDVDLFLPDSAFVFGEADRDARTALVSLVRLAHGPEGKPADADRLGRRTQAEAVHELGLLLGLSPCQDSRCAMFISHRPSDSDRKGPGLCATCRAALGLA